MTRTTTFNHLLLLSLHHEALLNASLLVLKVDVELREGAQLGAEGRVAGRMRHRGQKGASYLSKLHSYTL